MRYINGFVDKICAHHGVDREEVLYAFEKRDAANRLMAAIHGVLSQRASIGHPDLLGVMDAVVVRVPE